MSKDEEVKPAEGAPKADPKEPTAKAPEPKDNDPGDEANPEGKQGDSTEKKPRKPWHEKRIGELTYNWRQAERERDYWREFATKLAPQPQGAPAQQQAQASTKPQRANFASDEDYIEAVAEWKSEQKLSEWDRKRREEAERQENERRQQTVAKTFSEREAKARAKYEDYQEVAYSDDNPISELMAKVIYASEVGPEIAYFLGKNPDKGLQIAQMTDPHSVALALGRIEAQIEAAANPPQPVTPPAPKAAPTSAPPPPKVLSNSAPAQKRLSDDMPTAEWVRERNAQIRKKRA